MNNNNISIHIPLIKHSYQQFNNKANRTLVVLPRHKYIDMQVLQEYLINIHISEYLTKCYNIQVFMVYIYNYLLVDQH